MKHLDQIMFPVVETQKYFTEYDFSCKLVTWNYVGQNMQQLKCNK